jgi:hypothetical protein
MRVLCSLIVSGTGARALLQKSASFKDPKALRGDLLIIVAPWLAGVVVDGLLEDGGQTATAPATISGDITRVLKTETAARKLVGSFAVMRVDSGEPQGLSLMLQVLLQHLDADTDLDIVQSLVTTTLHGMKSTNSTTTKWLSTQHAVSHGFLCRISGLGLAFHMQALRYLEQAVARIPVAQVLEYLRLMVENAGTEDYQNGTISLKYIGIVEQLVPDKVKDEAVEFVIEYLHIGDDDDDEEEGGGEEEEGGEGDDGAPQAMDTD